MMRGPELRQLMEHMEWADAAVWQAVRAAPGATTDARLHALLHHVTEATGAFLACWRGEPVAMVPAAELATLEALEARSRQLHAGAAAFLAASPDFGARVEIPWGTLAAERFGHELPLSLADTVLQVTSHAAYHRGQVNARIRELGGEPPLVDYIIWLWAGRPPAEWPGASPATAS